MDTYIHTCESSCVCVWRSRYPGRNSNGYGRAPASVLTCLPLTHPKLNFWVAALSNALVPQALIEYDNCRQALQLNLNSKWAMAGNER